MPAAKSDTRAARIAFLYGNGDGNRVTNVQKLADQFNLLERTVRNHLPEWEKEFSQMAANGSEASLALSLSAESLALHTSTTNALAAYVEEQKSLITKLPKLVEYLKSTLDELMDAENRDYKSCCAAFRDFMAAMGSKKAAQSHLIKLQDAWKENAGIDSLQSVAESREKALAAGRVKLELQKELGNQPANLPPALPGARPGAFLDVPGTAVHDYSGDLEGV